MRPIAILSLAAALLAGCGGGKDQPPFSDLHPVKGVVMRNGQPVKGGAVRFNPDPDRPGFLINSDVAADGTFNLSTVRTTDSQGERKPGAPAGNYKVTFIPPLGDQTAGGQVSAIDLPGTVTVEAKENNLTIDLPKK
ncbi:MAG: hypothetical protein K2P78_09890 [Gemmataceae bacterium]|nr:hypothetical protein [Gemmataceae bacterium]